MSLINLFGFNFPLEWFIPLSILFVFMFLTTVKFFFFNKKKGGVRTMVAEFDKTGLCPRPPIVLKPDQEQLTRIVYRFPNTTQDRDVSKTQPISMKNVRTGDWERIFLVPKDSDKALNPESVFDESTKTKSPSRMMQEFAVWLGNIRGMLQPGFSIKKNAFLLLAWGGFMLMMGVFLADYVLPVLARSYH